MKTEIDPYLLIKLDPQFFSLTTLMPLLRAYCERMVALNKAVDLSEYQQAFVEIASPTSADLQAIGILLENGFASSAETLLRTQIERIGTIAYLRKSSPSETSRWIKGYTSDDPRPKWTKRLEALDELLNPFNVHSVENGDEFKPDMFRLFSSLHPMVHGDRISAWKNAHHDESATYIAMGSNPFNQEAIGRVSNYTGQILCYLIQEMNLTFPNLKSEFLSNAA
jgi:hypothetical protein